MKLSEIKSMFTPGQKVVVTRAGNTPLVIVGNLGNTVMPANNGIEERTCKAVKSAEWVFAKADGRNVHTPFPKASEIISASTGRVQFRYDNGTEVTIEAK